MERKHGRVIFLFPLILLIFFLQAAFQKDLTFLGMVDEGLALLFVPSLLWWMFGRGPKAKIGPSLILMVLAMSVFWTLGWISTYIHHFQPMSNAVKDAYLNLKFYFAMGLGFTLFDREKYSPLDSRRLRTRLWNMMNIIIFLLFAATVVDQIFHVFEGETRWIGVWCSQLTYQSYTFLVAQCILMAAILIRLNEYFGSLILIPMAEILYVIYATRRVKGLFMIPVILALYFLFLRQGEKNKKLTALVLILAGGGGVALAIFQTLYYYVYLGYESARAVLTMGGPWLAQKYFPFGTGWATYGSAFSVHPYSEVYHISGMYVVWGLSEEYDMFISDTFWPMIMGQTGFFGLAAYLVVVAVLIWWIWKRRNSRSAIFVSLLILFLYLMVMSTGESAFVNPMAVSMGFFMGFLLCESGKPRKVGKKGR